MKRLAAALLALMLLEMPAMAASDWNGTWASNWKDGNGVQIVMAGNSVSGVFWHGDYLADEMHSSVSPDGTTLTIVWGHSRAVLTRQSETTAQAMIQEPGKPDAKFPVTLDK